MFDIRKVRELQCTPPVQLINGKLVINNEGSRQLKYKKDNQDLRLVIRQPAGSASWEVAPYFDQTIKLQNIKELPLVTPCYLESCLMDRVLVTQKSDKSALYLATEYDMLEGFISHIVSTTHANPKGRELLLEMKEGKHPATDEFIEKYIPALRSISLSSGIGSIPDDVKDYDPFTDPVYRHWFYDIAYFKCKNNFAGITDHCRALLDDLKVTCINQIEFDPYNLSQVMGTRLMINRANNQAIRWYLLPFGFQQKGGLSIANFMMPMTSQQIQCMRKTHTTWPSKTPRPIRMSAAIKAAVDAQPVGLWIYREYDNNQFLIQQKRMMYFGYLVIHMEAPIHNARSDDFPVLDPMSFKSTLSEGNTPLLMGTNKIAKKPVQRSCKSGLAWHIQERLLRTRYGQMTRKIGRYSTRKVRPDSLQSEEKIPQDNESADIMLARIFNVIDTDKEEPIHRNELWVGAGNAQYAFVGAMPRRVNSMADYRFKCVLPTFHEDLHPLPIPPDIAPLKRSNDQRKTGAIDPSLYTFCKFRLQSSGEFVMHGEPVALEKKRANLITRGNYLSYTCLSKVNMYVRVGAKEDNIQVGMVLDFGRYITSLISSLGWLRVPTSCLNAFKILGTISAINNVHTYYHTGTPIDQVILLCNRVLAHLILAQMNIHMQAFGVHMPHFGNRSFIKLLNEKNGNNVDMSGYLEDLHLPKDDRFCFSEVSIDYPVILVE